MKPFLYEGYASSELAGVGFCVAGGLNAEVVREELPALLEDYRDLSWDAEGRLHAVGQDGNYYLDSRSARQYLEASADILNALGKV